jgi:hypothetical protein
MSACFRISIHSLHSKSGCSKRSHTHGTTQRSNSVVIFERDPEKLVAELLKKLEIQEKEQGWRSFVLPSMLDCSLLSTSAPAPLLSGEEHGSTE